MKSLVKKTVVGLAALVTTMSLAACGNSSSNSKTSDGKNEVTFWTFVPAHATFWKNAAKAWNKTHSKKEQIKLKANVLPFAQENEKLTVALQSGSGAPDMVDVEIGQTAIQLKASKPSYYPLNSALKPYMKYLQKSRMDNFAKNGKYYGIDYHVGTMVTYYNTELLKKAGINYQDIKTWDQYTKAGEQLKAKTGKWMTEIEYGGLFQLGGMVAQQKSDFTKDDQPNLTSPQVERALTMQQNWIYKDKIARSAVGANLDNDQFFAEFSKGNAASVTMPSWYMERLVDHMQKLKGKIAMAPMPVFNSGDYQTAAGGGTGTMVTNQAANKKLTAKFVAWGKASKGQAIKIWTELGFDPVRTDVWTSKAMTADNKYTEYFGKDIFATFSKLASQVHSINQKTPIAPTVNDYLLKNTLPSTINKDKMSAKQALKQAQAAVEKQIKASK